jgi:hypothetical protein
MVATAQPVEVRAQQRDEALEVQEKLVAVEDVAGQPEVSLTE